MSWSSNPDPGFVGCIGPAGRHDPAPAVPPSPVRVHLALLTVSVLFGGHYVFSKKVLGAVPAGSWAMFRILAATALLVPIAWLLRQKRALPERRTILWLGIAAFFGVALNQVLFFEGLERTTPAHSSVINVGIPVWTLLFAWLAGQERIGPRRVLAIGLAVTGVLYLLGLDDLLFGEPQTNAAEGGATLLGNVLTMLNGWAFALHLVLMRRIGKNLDPWIATMIMFAWASLFISSYGLLHVEAEHVDRLLTPPIAWCALYVVVCATVLTYLINNWALRHTHGSTVALYINVQPLCAVAIGALVGDALPGLRFYVALVLVSAGIWLQAKAKD